MSTYAAVMRVRSLLGRRADHLHRQRARHPARAERLDAVGAAVGDRPRVADLAGDLRAGLVDRVGQPGQPRRGCPGRPRSARGGSAPPARRRGRRPWSARPRPARPRGGSRSSASVTCAVRRPTLERRRLDRPVAQRDRAERRRCEHVRGHDRQARTRFSSEGGLLARGSARSETMAAWPSSTRSAGSWSGTPSWSPWSRRTPRTAGASGRRGWTRWPGCSRSCWRSGRWPGSACCSSGRKPDELSTHLGYLIASVCVMPLALRSVQDDRRRLVARRDRGRRGRGRGDRACGS